MLLLKSVNCVPETCPCRRDAHGCTGYRSTFQLIDKAGPNALASRSDGVESGSTNGTERKTVQASRKPNTTKTVETAKEQEQTSTSPNCTFSGVVPIDLKRFTDSCISLM